MTRDTNLTHRFLHARMSFPFVKTKFIMQIKCSINFVFEKSVQQDISQEKA